METSDQRRSVGYGQSRDEIHEWGAGKDWKSRDPGAEELQAAALTMRKNTPFLWETLKG